MSKTLTKEFATAFANDWIAAWNSGDLDRILAHYSDDFEMRSPLIQKIMNEASGVIKGKEKVRAYWAKGLQAQPPIRFKLQNIYVGASSVAIAYQSVGRAMVTEVLIFDAAGRVVSGNAMYGGEAAESVA